MTAAFVLAAARLLQDLPPEVRERLSDLPEALRQLERGTGGLRSWIEEMDTPLTIEGDVPPQDLAKARHAAERWLTASVSALQAIQRELERLHEGTGTVEGVTAQLEAAREIGEAVDRLLEGRAEVGDA